MGFSLKKFAEESLAQVNPFDKGRTAATVRAARSAPPAHLPSPVQDQIANAKFGVFANSPQARNEFARGEDIEQIKQNQEIRRLQADSLRGNINKAVANAGINNIANQGSVQANTAKNALRVNNRVVNPILGATAGLGRSVAGFGESASGLYDLATPGLGQNRFGKIAQRSGARADEFVNDLSLNKATYKGGQFAGDAVTFMAGGAPLKAGMASFNQGAKLIPVVGRAVNYVDDLAQNGTRIQRGVAKGAQYLARPDIASDIVADTALSTGLRSNRGQAITPTTTLVDAGMSTAFAGGLGLAGAGAKAVAKPVIQKLRSNNIVSPANLNPSEVADLQTFRQKAGTPALDEVTYQKGIAAAQKAGVDYRDPTAVDNLIGQFMTYQNRGTRLAPLNQGGYVRLPGGEQVDRPLYHGSPAADQIRKEGFKTMPDGVRMNGEGTYLTTERSTAKSYADGIGKNIVRSDIPKDAKILKMSMEDATTVNTKKLAEQGYDGLEVQTSPKHSNIVMFDPSKIKVKKDPQRIKKISNLSDNEMDSLTPSVIDFWKNEGFTGVSNGKRTLKFDQPTSGKESTADMWKRYDSLPDSPQKDKLFKAIADKQDNDVFADAYASGYDGATGTQKPKNPLADEARKYKSADEFVKAQKKIYRGQDDDVFNFDPKRQALTEDYSGVAFSRDKEMAEPYGKNILERYIPEERTLKAKDIPKKQLDKLRDDWKKMSGMDDDNPYSGNDNDLFDQEAEINRVVKIAQAQGKDAVDVADIYPFVAPEAEIRVLNPSILKDTQQLTDLYNQATQKPTPKPHNPNTILNKAADRAKRMIDLGEGGYIKNPLYQEPTTKFLRDTYDRTLELTTGKGKKFTVSEAKQLLKNFHDNKIIVPSKTSETGTSLREYTPKEFADALNNPTSNAGRTIQKYIDRQIDTKGSNTYTRIDELTDKMDSLEDNPNLNTPEKYKAELDRLENEKATLQDINKDPYVKQYVAYVRENADLIDSGDQRAISEALDLYESAENSRFNIDEEKLADFPETRLLDDTQEFSRTFTADDLNRSTTGISKDQADLLSAKPIKSPAVPRKQPSPEPATPGLEQKRPVSSEGSIAPERLYHGSDATFDTFDNKLLGSANGTAPINRTGFSFTDNPDVAKSFGKNVKEAKVDIKRPLVLDAKGQDYSVYKDVLNEKLSKADKSKYDGVIIKNYKDAGKYGEPTVSTHYIPFDSKQISTQPKAPRPTLDDALAGKSTKIKPEPAPETKLSRFANKTVQESDEVSTPLKKLVKKEKVGYTPHTNKARLAEADKAIANKSNDEAYTQAIRSFENSAKTTDQDVVTAIATAKKLDESASEDDLFKATEIYDNLSRHLTKKGQEVQAASLLNNRTPQGLRYYAQKQLKKAGVELTPDKQKQLDGLISAVKKSGEADQAIARDNVMDFISRNIPSKAGDKLINLWRAGLLTAPTTTAGASLANTMEVLGRKAWTNPVAVLSDAVMSMATGQRSQSLAKSGELGKGFKTGTKNATSKQYWKTGYDPMDKTANAIKYDAPTNRVNYGDNMAGRATGAYVNGVYSLMGAVDQPFRFGAQREVLSSLGKAEAINKGLKGSDRAKFVEDFIANPPTRALERATKEARYASFQDKTALGSAASSLKSGLRQRGYNKAANVAEFFMPFTGVPSSIATRMVKKTPVGTANEMVKQFINVRKGKEFDQRAMAQAIGEGTAGVPILAAGFALANAGQITGGYPADQKERKAWENEGKQPNSVRIGDRWYSLNYIQPFGSILNVGAGLAKADKEGKDVGSLIAQGFAEGGKSIKDMSFLQGISNGLDAISNPEYAGERLIANTASSLVPNAIRSAARASDDTQRTASGVVEGFKSGVPGLRQTLDKKLDVFGQPLPAKDNFANQYINPTRPSKVRGDTDDVSKEVSRLQGIDEGVLPTKIMKNTFGEESQLNEKQIRELQTSVGQATHKAWKDAVANPAYAKLSDEDKAKKLASIKNDITAVEKGKYAATNQLGEYSPTYTGKKSKLSTNEKRLAQGKSVDYFSKADDEATFSEQYESAKTKYDEDKADMTRLQRIKAEDNIRELEVKKNYDKDTVSLYGMNKTDVYGFLNSDKNGKALAQKLIAYGDARVKAGLDTTNKFKDKYGNVAIRPKEKSSGGKRGKGGRKTDFSLYGKSGGADFVSTDKTLRALLNQARIKTGRA